jgi:hypothetical protein
MLGRAQVRKAPAKGAAARSVAISKPSPWQGLWRQVGWGLAAAAALGIAIISGRNEAAPQQFAFFFSSLHGQQSAASAFDAEGAARQLAQALRGLADDRDRLATRLNAFEREMRDMNAGIKQQIEEAKAEAIKTAKQAPPWPESAPPVPMTLADIAVMVKRISPPQASAADPPPAPPPGTAEQAPPETTASVGQSYGADLGSASTIKTLHQRWAALRNAHPEMFAGVQPVVSVKQNPRSGRTELHLIVGPYANAETAAQFCDFVVPLHVNCQPAMFDGSRLALQ